MSACRKPLPAVELEEELLSTAQFCHKYTHMRLSAPRVLLLECIAAGMKAPCTQDDGVLPLARPFGWAILAPTCLHATSEAARQAWTAWKSGRAQGRRDAPAYLSSLYGWLKVRGDGLGAVCCVGKSLMGDALLNAASTVILPGKLF